MQIEIDEQGEFIRWPLGAVRKVSSDWSTELAAANETAIASSVWEADGATTLSGEGYSATEAWVLVQPPDVKSASGAVVHLRNRITAGSQTFVRPVRLKLL